VAPASAESRTAKGHVHLFLSKSPRSNQCHSRVLPRYTGMSCPEVVTPVLDEQERPVKDSFPPWYVAMKLLSRLNAICSQLYRYPEHLGSSTECRYSLKQFGIPGEYVPFSSGPSARDEMKIHLQWCQLQQSKEELIYADPSNPAHSFFDMESVIVECPQNEDCLFGKGRAIMKHPGTLGMHNLLKSKMDRWSTATFKEKNGLTWEVVHEILSVDGRFLQQDPSHGWFVPVEDEVARQKVSIAFRDMAKRIRKRSQKQSQEKTYASKRASSSSVQLPVRDRDHYLSTPNHLPYGASDSETSDGADCSFLCARNKNQGPNIAGQRGYDKIG
jgi:hypothetical protein